MTTRNKHSKKSSSYFGSIETRNGELNVIYVDIKSEKEVPELSFVVKGKFPTIKEFIENIPKIFTTKFKAILLRISNFKTSEFSNNYKFCEAIKAQLDAIKIPYYFITVTALTLTSLFADKNIMVNINDTVIAIFTENDKYCIGEFQFTKKGYKCIRSFTVDANQEPEDIRNEILRSAKPVKIVATTLISDEKNRRLLFNLINVMHKYDALIFGDCNTFSSMTYGVVEISKWILNNNLCNFYVLPRCDKRYMLVGKGDDKIPSITLAEDGYLLPFEGTVNVARSNVEYILAYKDYDFPNPQYLEPIRLFKNCHRSKIIFKIDINNFYSYQIESIVYEETKNLPATLNKKENIKIPVIGFVDNFSIICVCKNGEYKFADEWNGFVGEELLISFADEKPKFCHKALDDWKRKPTAVVFALIPIMSMPADKVDAHSLWGFTITKDDENPVLIEFDNFDGTKKAASPAFLMAMLLKENLKVIKNEMGGKKPKEIGFVLFNKMNSEKKARVQNGLKEACELLKIQCRFIEI